MMRPPRTSTSLLAALALAGSLAACGNKNHAAEQTSQPSAAPTQAPAAPAPAPAAAASPPPATETAQPQPAATFDLSAVPVSSANLGRFPYLGALKGYRTRYDSDSVGYDFERTYIYDGKRLMAVEGKVVRREFRPMNDKKKASALMIQRNYADLIKGLGGVQVSAGKIPEEVVKTAGAEYENHKGNISANIDVDTYLIRQKDKEVWVQVVADESNNVLNVTERAAMPQQAGVLKADELKKN